MINRKKCIKRVVIGVWWTQDFVVLCTQFWLNRPKIRVMRRVLWRL